MTEFWNRCEGQSVGSYLLLKHLSGFARSAVYAAESGQDTQPAAIKLLQIDDAERELRLSAWSALAPLSHPHLIRVFEAGQCEIDGVSLLYLAMERADGDLAGVLAERALTPAEAYETLEPSLQALVYLHDHGYVYGGLKPSRVLAIGEEVKLSSDCITRSGQTQSHRAGTVYDPPEWEEGTVSPEGDVWSLGATLVRALTQNSPQPDPGGAGPLVPANLPEPFLTIARNCLRPDPKSRWSLAQIASHLHGPQPTSPPVPTHTESENRRPRMSSYWIAAVALAVISIFIVIVRDRRASPPPSQPASVAVSPSLPPARPEPAAPLPRNAIGSSDNWFVVVATYARKEDAEKRARSLERQSPDFKAEVYAPSRSAKPYYLVVIGSNLSEKAAIDLRSRAGSVAADAYVTRFNP
jgi:serine/threonine protein kinase